MACNTKYQQKAYIIIMFIHISGNILCHFLCDLTNNFLLKMGSLLSKYGELINFCLRLIQAYTKKKKFVYIK